jgi:UDP-N-acetylmuramoyl-tripeptide--D-alanyl-D-alanine ligase
MKIGQLYNIYKNNPKVFTDSRKAAEGGIFFALKGDRFNGMNLRNKPLKREHSMLLLTTRNFNPTKTVLLSTMY